MLCYVFILLSLTPSAVGDTEVHIEPIDWTWEAGEAATISGSVRVTSGVTDPCTVQISVESIPESEPSGRIVFTTVNDQKLTIRNQKSEYVFSAADTPETSFIASWFVPEQARLTGVNIEAEVFDGEGHLLARETVKQNSDLNTAGNSAASSFPDMSRMIWILLAAAVIVWILAIIRILMQYRKRNQ